MPKIQVDKALIRELGELLDENNLTEIELCDGSRSVRVSRAATAAPAAMPQPAAPPSVQAGEAPPTGAENGADHPGAVTSPMVGTIYLASQPDVDAFIKVGDQVTQGQTLLIIEAMKVMNQIPAPHGGVVKEIAVQNAQPVEFGDLLVIIE
jgi:acetyl-CoA carboxylase biotin carboxyl carrier protein